MANKRTFEAQGLIVNGVSIGGLATIGTTEQYREIVESAADQVGYVEYVDRAGLSADLNIVCKDVKKANAALAAAVGNTTFSGRESGSALFTHHIIAGTVLTGMDMSFTKNADGQLTLLGALRFPAGAADLADLITVNSGDATPPALTHPTHLYRPNTAVFTPDGGVAIAALHVQGVNLSLRAAVIRDSGDGDATEEAVDVVGFGPLNVSMTFRDALEDAATAENKKSEILNAARGVLTVALAGRGGAANETLTVNNLLPVGSGQTNKHPDYTDHTLNFRAGWRKPGVTPVVYTLNGATKLWTIA